jgi:hypothetical protein
MTGDAPARSFDWLTVKEAAARAKCSTQFIYLATGRGRLRASRLVTKTVEATDGRSVERWIARRADAKEANEAK